MSTSDSPENPQSSGPSLLVRALLSTPAVLVLLAVIGFGFYVAVDKQLNPIRPKYQAFAEWAAEEENAELALICYRRLVAEQPRGQKNRYAMAELLDELGRESEAIAIMHRLATDGDGYAPANQWLGRKMTASGTSSPRARRLAKKHLETAGDIVSLVLLAELFVRDREYEEAKRIIEVLEARLGRTDPESAGSLRLARLEREIGETGLAERRWSQALAALRSQQAEEGQDFQGWNSLIEVASLLPDAETIHQLLDGRLPAPKEDLTDETRAMLYVRLMQEMGFEQLNRRDALPNSVTNDLARRKEDPNPSAPTIVLMSLQAMDGTNRASIQATLTKAIRSDPKVADDLLALADLAKSGPTAPYAGEILDALVRHSPEDADYRLARGRLRLRTGRAAAALADLEMASRARPNDEEIRRVLASVRTRLGMFAVETRGAKPSEPSDSGDQP